MAALLFSLGTLTDITSWKDQLERNRLQKETSVTAEQDETNVQAATEDTSPLQDLVVSEEEWNNLDLSDRQDLIVLWTETVVEDLGLEGDFRITFTHGLSNDTLAYYKDHRIDNNDAFLSTAKEPDMLNAVFHECFHAYQEVVSNVYTDLLEQGVRVDKMPDFERVSEYIDAYGTYASDSATGFASYEANRLEYYARAFAESQVAKLASVI